MFLHVFGHIHSDQCIVIAKQRFGQRFGQFCLANAGRAEEKKRTDGAFGVFQPDTASPYGLRNGAHRLLLPDDALMESRLQVPKPLALLLCQALHRDASPAGHNIRNLLFIDDILSFIVLPLPDQFRLLQLIAQLFLFLFDVAGALEVLHGDSRFLLLRQLFQPLLHRLDGRGRCKDTETHFRARLIDEVDGLIRQIPVGDIPGGKPHRSLDRLVRDADAVMGFVFILQSLKDQDRLVLGGLLNLDRLESALQRRVLLDVLAVLIQRRSADELNLTSRQRRLENV